jgi:hypothetical protein
VAPRHRKLTQVPMMRSIVHRLRVSSIIGTCLLAALYVVSVPADAILDNLTDELISPPCRIGSLQSWQGKPCVVPLGTPSAGDSADSD